MISTRTVRLPAIGLLLLSWGGSQAPGQCTVNELTKLTASDAVAGDWFAMGVSISGDVAVIGAPISLGGGAATGSAYLYVFNGSAWIEQAKLTASDGAWGDRFGFSVSISGDVVVVGAYGDDDGGSKSGSAYLFEKPPGGWVDMTETAKLTASDAAANDWFGWSVSISGDAAVVGAYGDDDGGSKSGSAYLFEKPPGGWATATEDAKLTASDAAADDFFGWSVSISGDVAVVGAHKDDDAGSSSGSAYLFVKPPGGWATATEDAKLTASDAAMADQFGGSVSISGDVVLVGASGDDDGGADSGSAYLFVKPPGGWATATEDAKLTASDAAAGDAFGSSVSIGGDAAVVGATGDDDGGSNSGSAYVFAKPPGGWATTTEDAKLTASDPAASDLFGGKVSISGEAAVIGAQYDDDGGTNSGSAYVYAGLGDCNTNGTLDLCDITDGTSQDCDANQVPDECDPDTDGDNTPDGCDGCVNDASKTAPGQCGCNNPDTDTDGDNTADCIDGCASDAAKAAPGTCGCGVADTDADGDGVADCVDNCPVDANADQADSDGDGVGDACAGAGQVTPACGCGAVSAGVVGLWALFAAKLARRQRRRRR